MGVYGRFITRIFHDAIVGNPDCPISVAEIADRIGKSKNQLYLELRPNPRTDGKTSEKLSFDDGVEILEMLPLNTCQKILRTVAAHLGFAVVPLARSGHCRLLTPDNAFKELVDIAEESGRLAAKVKESVENDGKLTVDELEEISSICADLQAEVADVAEGARCAAESLKKGLEKAS